MHVSNSCVVVLWNLAKLNFERELYETAHALTSDMGVYLCLARACWLLNLALDFTELYWRWVQDILQQPRLVLHLVTTNNTQLHVVRLLSMPGDSAETLQAHFIQNILFAVFSVFAMSDHFRWKAHESYHSCTLQELWYASAFCYNSLINLKGCMTLEEMFTCPTDTLTLTLPML